LREVQPPAIARRLLLALPVQLINVGKVEAAQTAYENLEYRGGRLYWSQASAAASIGRAGIKTDKREGDGATPAGTYPLVSVLYRADRISRPASCLPVSPLEPNHGWVDDPGDANYNRLVSLPYAAGTEKMWRQDRLYDALVVIGYNMQPVIPRFGSAIFLHIARSDFSSTQGCIAVKKEILLGLLPLLGPGSTITIRV
jgi:L,D-peptidoglycan transpeptidase YkuD (ErfK/YbiS/YcfS/YnhG family)